MALQPYVPLTAQLERPTDEQREIVSRAESRRLALSGDQQLLRARYEEVMRWVNPPWDPVTRRLDPRQEAATMERGGENILHVDLVGPSVDRWAVLQMGAPPIFRIKPRFIAPPVEDPDDAEQTTLDRKLYNLDRAQAQLQSSKMEAQTQDWAEAANLHRTLLWAAWSVEAFGKGIIKTGWDPDELRPTAELYENPSTVYYGWSKRYGNRQLSWAMVVDEMSPDEAEVRFGLDLPKDGSGHLDWATWTGLLDQGDMDQRAEQQAETQGYVNVEEFWELVSKKEVADDGTVTIKRGVQFSLILAGRVIEGPTFYEFMKRIPFQVFEGQHIATWPHGKSTAETVIPINTALDDMWDRQHDVIEFEAGPRFKGLNMANSGDEVDIPDPFHLIPLREGEDIAQIDTRVDFFPTELHSNQMFEGLHRSTGLTPIAWGMSPNAQTSGRAMSAEWRAVELPLTSRLINLGPSVKEIVASWWDYAEAYDPETKKISHGYRKIVIVWVPLDIRDRTEKTADVINRLQANIIDPETAIEETGYENSDEIIAKIRAYLVDPIWNPLRYQQYLTLQQLELSIRQQALQVQAMEAEAAGAGAAPPAAGPGQPSPGELAQQGAVAAGQAAQGVNPATEAANQPGQAPGGLPIDTSILSQTPLEGGIGNRAIVNPAGGPSPTGGQQPQ